MEDRSVSPLAAKGVRERVSRRAYLTLADGRRNIAEIAAMHAALTAWLVFAFTALPLWAAVLLSLPVCAVHQRHASEWLHEGLHFNIHPERRTNAFVSTWMLAALFGLPLAAMRRSHFEHHGVKRFFNAQDPDTVYAIVTDRRSVVLALLRDLSGLTAVLSYLQVIVNRLKPVSDGGAPSAGGQNGALTSALRQYWPVIVVQFLFLGTTMLFAHPEIWAVYYASLVTLYPLLSRLRLYGQHVMIDPHGRAVFADSNVSRTVDGTWLDRILISSHLMCFHHEHHAKPHLPFRALRALARPVEGDPNRYTRSHLPVLKALMKDSA